MKTLILAVALMAVPLAAQTAGELLQEGIFDQETAGDLDGAIAIYHQIVNSGSSPRDVAAQAQYRLAQSLLQKGDLSNGAQEFSNLARNYADYGKLVSSLAAQARRFDLTAEQRDQVKAKLQALEAQRAAAGVTIPPEQQAKMADMLAREMDALLKAAQEQEKLSSAIGGRAGGRSMAMTSNAPATTVTGIIASIAFVTPAGTITVDSSDGTGKRYRFWTAGPAELGGQGFTHDSLRPGDQVTITGILANGGQTADGVITGSATTITGQDGRKLFDRAMLSPSSNPCHWVSATVPPPCPANK